MEPGNVLLLLIFQKRLLLEVKQKTLESVFSADHVSFAWDNREMQVWWVMSWCACCWWHFGTVHGGGRGRPDRKNRCSGAVWICTNGGRHVRSSFQWNPTYQCWSPQKTRLCKRGSLIQGEGSSWRRKCSRKYNKQLRAMRTNLSISLHVA